MLGRKGSDAKVAHLLTVSIHCHFVNFRAAAALAEPSTTERTAPSAQSSGHYISESTCCGVFTSVEKPSPTQTSGDAMGNKNHNHLQLNVRKLLYNVTE